MPGATQEQRSRLTAQTSALTLINWDALIWSSTLMQHMVLLDRRTELIWQAFKLYMPPGTTLNDVIRPAEEQLRIIVKDAKNLGYRFTNLPRLQLPSSWEPALKFIRNRGFDVAAPGASRHAQRYAFDLGHSPSATDHDLEAIAAGLRTAAANRRITLMPPRGHWPNPKIELKNRCVHVEISSALLDFEPFDFV